MDDDRLPAFREIEDAFPRYRSGAVQGSAIEVFPHATAVVLSGFLPPTGMSPHAWRRTVLGAQSVDGAALRSADQVDAALAALTGLFAIERRFSAPGDPREGKIVLPPRRSPRARTAVPPPPLAPASSRRSRDSRPAPAATRSAPRSPVASSRPGTTPSASRRCGPAPGRGRTRSTSSGGGGGRSRRRCDERCGGRDERGRDGVRDPGDPRRPGPRGRVRLGQRADLPDLDLRAAGGRQAEGVGLRARREPDARGAAAGARLARGRIEGPVLLERPRARRRPCCSR